MVNRLNQLLEIFNRIENDVESYTTQVLGKDILVYPNVFSPKYCTDSAFFAEEVPKLVGNEDKFLEIGTGTGVVAAFVGMNGVGRLLATDINPDAAKNARQNFENLNVDGEVLQGHLYEPIGEERFDVIFWNHPFHWVREKVSKVLHMSGLDNNYHDLDEWFQKGKNHLTPGGKLLLGTGIIARLDLVEEIASKHGYRSSMVATGTRQQLYGDVEVTETFYIYEFVVHHETINIE